MTTENFIISANFNTCSEDTLRVSNKGVCTYTFQKLEACPKTRHLEIRGVSTSLGKTAYNSALRCGVVFAMQFPQPTVGLKNPRHSVPGVDQKGFSLRDH